MTATRAGRSSDAICPVGVTFTVQHCVPIALVVYVELAVLWCRRAVLQSKEFNYVVTTNVSHCCCALCKTSVDLNDKRSHCWSY